MYWENTNLDGLGHFAQMLTCNAGLAVLGSIEPVLGRRTISANDEDHFGSSNLLNLTWLISRLAPMCKSIHLTPAAGHERQCQTGFQFAILGVRPSRASQEACTSLHGIVFERHGAGSFVPHQLSADVMNCRFKANYRWDTQ